MVLHANCVYSKVQVVKVGCFNHRFSPFAGGPSGSGKTSFAHKMANIVGCEVVSMESYYKAEEVKDSNYDEFSTLDLPLLLKVCVCFHHSGLIPFCILNDSSFYLYKRCNILKLPIADGDVTETLDADFC